MLPAKQHLRAQESSKSYIVLTKCISYKLIHSMSLPINSASKWICKRLHNQWLKNVFKQLHVTQLDCHVLWHLSPSNWPTSSSTFVFRRLCLVSITYSSCVGILRRMTPTSGTSCCSLFKQFFRRCRYEIQGAHSFRRHFFSRIISKIKTICIECALKRAKIKGVAFLLTATDLNAMEK